jgi:hypothetical protein
MCKSIIVVCSALVMMIGIASAGEPKEGKISGTYHGVGTFKAATMGKDGAVISGWDETSYAIPKEMAFEDHLTMHCFGSYLAIGGKSKSSGACVGTGLAPGDEAMWECSSDGMQAVDAKTITGKCNSIGGTGRYANITYTWSYEARPNDYKVAPGNNSYVALSTYNGTYKSQ